MGLNKVIAIVGPTASGKSALAESVAKVFDGEIISADSMQIYKGMDIGTAKVPFEERTVPYHCIDIVEPGEPYSAALFQNDARSAIDFLFSQNKTPVLCGGTGLYVRAALDAFEFPKGEQVDNPVREKYETLANELGPEAFHALLKEKDPDSAALIHPNNVRRVVRAFELLEEGESYAKKNEGFSDRESIYPTIFIGLSVDSEILYERINSRIDNMIKRGLLGEVQTLLSEGFESALTSSQAIGYKEFVPVLSGEKDLKDALEECKQATRRYSKRQRTWFKADPRINWFNANDGITSQLVEDICHFIEAEA